MRNQFDKYVTCLRLFARIESGLGFIRTYIKNSSDKVKTNPDHLRSLYILLSYHFELLLKAYLILQSDFKTPNDAYEELQRSGHDLVKMSKKIGSLELNKIGITEISFANKEYSILTKDGDIKIKDFTDIRYDFLPDDKGRVKMRYVPTSENENLLKSILLAEKILMNLKQEVNLFRAL